MFKFWLQCIPLTVGILITVLSVMLMAEFARDINLFVGKIDSEAWPYLLLGFTTGLIGVPLCLHGIKQFTRGS